MANFCLPKKYTQIFADAVDNGVLSPARLINLSSAERRATFSELLGGEDTAREVNTLFEQAVIKKNQQRAIQEWVKTLKRARPEIRADLSAKVQKMANILNPKDEKSFLEDAVRKGLGASVTSDQAKTILKKSNLAEKLKTISDQDPKNEQKRITWGRSIVDLKDYVEDLKPDGKTFTQRVVRVVGIPKTLLTSAPHMSGLVVQAWALAGEPIWYKAWPEMFKYLWNEENYQNLRAAIVTDPYYNLAVDGELSLPDANSKISYKREASLPSTIPEQFNELISKYTGLPNIIRANSRAFTGALSFIRYYHFVELVKAAEKSGYDISVGNPVLKQLAKAVNDITGRGSIGKNDSFRNAMEIVNTVFLSPRKLLGVAKVLYPWNYIRPGEALSKKVPMIGELFGPGLTGTARKAQFRHLIGLIGVTGAVIGLANLMGAKVDYDPIDTDFLRIQTPGGEKIEVGGAYIEYIRFAVRFFMGEERSSSGVLYRAEPLFGKENIFKDYSEDSRPTTRGAMLVEFLRGKLSPMASQIATALDNNKNMLGQKETLGDIAKENLMSITMQEWLDYYYNNPNDAADIIPAVSAALGVQIISPNKHQTKYGVNYWGSQ